MLDAWMIGIVGVIALGVLLEILLPEGQTGKYVKGAFSLLVILVIAAPLPGVIGALKDWDPSYSDIAPDYGLVEETTEERARYLARGIEQTLEANGYETDVKVVIKEGSTSEIDEITVTLYLAVLSQEEVNKHISDVTLAVRRIPGTGDAEVTVTPKTAEVGDAGE